MFYGLEVQEKTTRDRNEKKYQRRNKTKLFLEFIKGLFIDTFRKKELTSRHIDETEVVERKTLL